MAVTRVCVIGGSSGVPVGAHIAWLSINKNGCPFEVMRVEPVVYCAVTHGPFAPGGGGNVQPAITYGAVINTVGCPHTNTRGFTTVGVACPACEHNTVAPR